MRRLLKSWTFWLFAVPGALLGAVLLLHFETRGFDCVCDSSKTTRRLYFGFGASVVRLASFTSETSSEFSAEILGDRHAHAWLPTGSDSLMSLSGRGYIGCGIVHRSPLADVYRRTPAFRPWIKAKVAKGEIDAAAIDREMTRGTYYAKGEYPFGWTPP